MIEIILQLCIANAPDLFWRVRAQPNGTRVPDILIEATDMETKAACTVPGNTLELLTLAQATTEISHSVRDVVDAIMAPKRAPPPMLVLPSSFKKDPS